MTFALNNRSILVVSPENWNFLHVSKHHYAMELARRNNLVFFLNPPESNPKSPTVTKSNIDNLYIIDYKQTLRGVNYLPKSIRMAFNKYLIEKISKIIDRKIDTLLSFENSRFFDLDIKDIYTIYFQVDQNQNFNPRKAAITANITLAINDEIKEILEKYTTNVYKLPHAFHSNKTLQNKINTQAKTAGYIGNLDNYHLDIELLEKVIKNNGNTNFKLIGPYNKDNKLYQTIQKYKNVSFIGKVEWLDIPKHSTDIDLFIVTYNKSFRYSSHKILEYLATGKPIVSTYLDEYRDTGLLEMTDNDNYLQLFSKVIESYAKYTKAEDIQKRISFAQQNTYSARVDQLNELINRHSKTHA